MRTSIIAAFLAILSLVGCVDGADPTSQSPEPSTAVAEAQGVPAEQLQDIAIGHAGTWNDNARLHLVSTFEGNLAAVPSPQENRWVAPYLTTQDPWIDGRATLWSFTFVDGADPLETLGQTVCDAGTQVEVRDAYVVTLDEQGNLVTAYETQDDDEGAPSTGPLPKVTVTSSDAAAIANQRSPMTLDHNAWSQTFLVAQWFGEGVHWAFVIRDPGDTRLVLVDAMTGDISHDGDPIQPRC